MDYTCHCETRANQRGIKKEVLELVDELGADFGDKIVLNRKNCRQYAEALSGFIRLIDRISKDGGSLEISADRAFLNAYRHTEEGGMRYLGQIRI